MSLSVALLHEGMLDKQGAEVTTSLTLIDIHDISRSSKTYGLQNVFIAHPAETLRKLAEILAGHWQQGYGATYNPDRKSALDILKVFSHFEQALEWQEETTGKKPILIATSAKDGPDRVSYESMREKITETDEHYILMLGTGWGMSEELMSKADHILDPVYGPGDYNHLSVRSACAIMLDRLVGRR